MPNAEDFMSLDSPIAQGCAFGLWTRETLPPRAGRRAITGRFKQQSCSSLRARGAQGISPAWSCSCPAFPPRARAQVQARKLNLGVPRLPSARAGAGFAKDTTHTLVGFAPGAGSRGAELRDVRGEFPSSRARGAGGGFHAAGQARLLPSARGEQDRADLHRIDAMFFPSHGRGRWEFKLHRELNAFFCPRAGQADGASGP